MAIKADTRYNGEVLSGSLFEAGTGTLGYQVWLKCDDGEIDYIIWLTKKSKESGKAEKDFAILGVGADCLRSREGILSVSDKIKGAKVSFETRSETYKEKTRIKVAWISEVRQAGDMFSRAAAFFSGESAPSEPHDDPESVPF